MTSIRNQKARKQFLEKEIAILKNRLSNSPQGTLFTRRQSDGTYKYYHRITISNGNYKEFYISKQNHEEALQLANKMVNEKRLEDYQKENKLLQKELDFQEKESEENAFLRKHPGIAALFRDQEYLAKDPGSQWKNAPYNRNQNYPEDLKYSTIVPNLLVRSKSESTIVNALEHYKVPYHYDEILSFDGETVAIDFVCLNARTGLVYYWDHRGMLDDPRYIGKTLYCENLFLKNGIIPWVNLIVTIETQKHPLDIQWVNTIIEYYLI